MTYHFSPEMVSKGGQPHNVTTSVLACTMLSYDAMASASLRPPHAPVFVSMLVGLDRENHRGSRHGEMLATWKRTLINLRGHR